MSLPSQAVMKTDAKLNFMEASNISLGTRNGYSSITTTAHSAVGGNAQFQDKEYSITSNEFMDSDVKARAKLVFRIYNPAADVGPLTDVTDNIGLCPFPVNSLFNTAKVKLNGLTKSTNVSELVEMFAPAFDREIGSLISPCFAPDSLSIFPQTDTLNNPLRFKDDTSRLFSLSRGLGVNYKSSVSLVAAGVESAPLSKAHYKVEVELTERLMASPFLWNLENPQPFYQPRNMTIDLNLNQNAINRIVNQSINENYVVGTLPNDKPCDIKIVTTTYTPHLEVQVPSTLYYNNPNLTRKSLEFSSISADGKATLNLNSININGMPSMFALCVSNEGSRYDPFKPLQTFNILSMKIRLGSKSGILSGYEQEDLYNVSRKNGYNLPYMCFSGEKLDITAADYSEGSSNNCWFYFSLSDLDTENLVVDNSSASAELQITVEVENRLGEEAIPTAILYYVRDDVSWDENGRWESKDAILTSEQIEDAKPMYEDMNESDNVLGGRRHKFWKGLKNFSNFLGSKGVKNVVKTLRKSPLGAVLPGAVHVGAEALGYGVVRNGKGMVKTAGAKRKPAKRKAAKRKGGAVLRTAGKKMTKAQMKRKYGL